jgi:hypothetical protein
VKTITVPRTAGNFHLNINPGRANARFEVDVVDDDLLEVATVVVHPDGSAEPVTVGPLYRSEDARWWADLATEVAKAVA